MKRIVITVIATVFTIFYATAQEDITGVWWVNDQKGKVEISEENGVVKAKLVWLKNSKDRKGNPVTDRNNPDKQLRSRKLIGIEMIEDLRWSDGGWVGKLYSPERGRYVSGELDLVGEDKLRITVSFMGQTRQRTWERASS